MKKKFLKNTFVLTLTYQILRIIGIYFIAFLSGKIGTEGVGLYQLILSVYVLAATFASSGLGIAVSRLTAESIGKSRHQTTSNVLRRAIVIGLCLSAVFGAVLYVFADFIGLTFLGDPRSILSIRMLAPGLPFMAVSSSLQGYFYGLRKVIKPATQMIFEQIVRLLVIMMVINAFVPLGLEYACFAIILSSMISEALSCAYAFILYIHEKRQQHMAVAKEPGVTKKILKISVPIAISAYIRTILRTAENMLIPLGLKKNGASHKDALSQFGMIGMVMPILFFPSGLWTAVGTLLVPELSEASALNNSQRVKSIFAAVFQMSVMLSVLFCGIFIAFAKDFGVLIYQNAEIGRLLLWLAPLVPLIYLDFVVDSMLSGLDQQLATLKINILDSALRVVLIFTLVPRFGLVAFIVIMYISAVLNGTLSIRRLLKASHTGIRYVDWIIKPLMCIAASALIVRLLFYLLPFGAVMTAANLTLKILLLCIIYTALLFITQCLKKTNIVWLKKLISRRRDIVNR